MNNHYEDVDDLGNESLPRRRKPDGHVDAGVYNDLQRLRSLVDVIGDNGGSSCFPIGLDNSMMSTIFGLVFAVIMTVTFYAFFSLYKAISKRFFQDIM